MGVHISVIVYLFLRALNVVLTTNTHTHTWLAYRDKTNRAATHASAANIKFGQPMKPGACEPHTHRTHHSAGGMVCMCCHRRSMHSTSGLAYRRHRTPLTVVWDAGLSKQHGVCRCYEQLLWQRHVDKWRKGTLLSRNIYSLQVCAFVRA